MYFFNIIFSVLYSFYLRNKKFNFIIFLPILLLWTFIIGFQYCVGTDYSSYLKIYNTNKVMMYYFKKEILFYYFIIFLRKFFSNGQVLFIAVGILYNSLLYFSLKRLCSLKYILNKNMYIWIFLFLCFGTTFYNQMNGVRNYIAVYFFFLGWTYLIEKKYIKYLIFIFLGTGFHRTCFFLIAFLFLEKFFIKKSIKTSRYLIILLLGTALLLLLPLNHYVEEYVKIFFPMYCHYLLNSSFVESMPLLNIVSRLIWFPFYYLSIKVYKKTNNKLIIWGVFGYCTILLSAKMFLLNRVTYYTGLLSIFPIYYLIIDKIKEKKYILLFFLIGLIVILIVVKLLILGREYEYNSYIFIYFK